MPHEQTPRTTSLLSKETGLLKEERGSFTTVSAQ